MQAITSKYLGATLHRGSRFKATTAGGQSVTVPYDYELSTTENHKAVAQQLLTKLGWKCGMVGGTQSNAGKGEYGRMVWVISSGAMRISG